MALTTTIRILFGSKWRVALRRAQLAGKMLALLLMQVMPGRTGVGGGGVGNLPFLTVGMVRAV
jgi:hypothetical protein